LVVVDQEDGPGRWQCEWGLLKTIENILIVYNKPV
jgi:hypothetical protein